MQGGQRRVLPDVLLGRFVMHLAVAHVRRRFLGRSEFDAFRIAVEFEIADGHRGHVGRVDGHGDIARSAQLGENDRWLLRVTPSVVTSAVVSSRQTARRSMAREPAIFDVDLRLGDHVVRARHVPIPDLHLQQRLQR